MKKTIITLSVIGVIVCVLFVLYYLFVVSGAFLMLNYFAPNPPKPEITYGEFPFTLTYEIDGEIKTIEDTLICEFDGFEMSDSGSKYRKWNSYLKSGNEYVTLLDLTSSNEINEYGHIMQELYFYYGNAEYYMGDLEHYRCIPAQSFEEVCYKCQRNDGGISHSAYSAENAYEKYKIRFIDWKIAEPIKNQF